MMNYELFCTFAFIMLQDELIYQIETRFGHVPTYEQRQALQEFAAFMTDRDEQVVMILRGSAGTGKTTLASAIVRAMVALHQKMVLMAPTGRSTDVFTARRQQETSRHLVLDSMRLRIRSLSLMRPR